MKSKNGSLSPPKAEPPSGYIVKEKQLVFTSETLPGIIAAIHSAGGVCRFRAKGSSMNPFIGDGDILSIRSCVLHNLQTGKVAAFIQQDKMGKNRVTVHRIIHRKKTGFYFKGDNMKSRDRGPVSPSQVIGEVIRIEREGSKVMLGISGAGWLIASLSRFNAIQSLVEALRFIKNTMASK